MSRIVSVLFSLLGCLLIAASIICFAIFFFQLQVESFNSLVASLFVLPITLKVGISFFVFGSLILGLGQIIWLLAEINESFIMASRR